MPRDAKIRVCHYPGGTSSVAEFRHGQSKCLRWAIVRTEDVHRLLFGRGCRILFGDWLN